MKTYIILTLTCNSQSRVARQRVRRRQRGRRGVLVVDRGGDGGGETKVTTLVGICNL